MPHALNLTMKIKQDAETQAELKHLVETFATTLQPKIDAALRESRKVHSARLVVIDNLYLQVLTVYDGDHLAYTEFFRKKLPDVFAKLFSLAEAPPAASSMGNPDAFFTFASGLQRRSLGESDTGELGQDKLSEGYLFSAYGKLEVQDILPKLDM